MIEALAAFCAAIAIGAGAFGTHGAEGQAAEWLKTGSFYLLIHAVAVLGMVGQSNNLRLLLLYGAALFAATLYAMALGAPRWLGAVTPIGGTAMIIGWLLIGWQHFRQ